MASSLRLGRFNLLDPASPVTLYRSGFDRGNSVPTLSEVQSSVLDGARVTGRNSGNRHPVYPLKIEAADRLTMVSLENEIQAIVDSETWAVTFSPDGGFPVVIVNYRATIESTSDLIMEGVGVKRVTVSCDAQPFAKSPAPVSFSLASSGLVIDDMETSGATYTSTIGAATRVTYRSYSGAASVVVTLPDNAPAFTITRTGASVAVPQALTTVTMMAVQSAATTLQGQFTLQIKCTDGSTYAASTQATLKGWTPLVFQMAIPSGKTINGWVLSVPSFAGQQTNSGGGLWVDFLTGVGTAGATVSSARGAVVTVPKVYGTANAPAAVALARTDGSAFGKWCLHTPPEDTPGQPLVPLSSGTGSTSATFGGTYSVFMAVGNTNGSSSTAPTLTIQQSTPSGTVIATRTLTTTDPNAKPNRTTLLAGYGEVTLPLVPVPDGMTTVHTFTGVVPGTYTTFDVLLLNTAGQTVMPTMDAPTAVGAWVDEAVPGAAFGLVSYGADRYNAVSNTAHQRAGAALQLPPGQSTMMLYCCEGSLAATCTYYPRWLQDAYFPLPSGYGLGAFGSGAYGV